jgi:signal transduction histidine kinase
VFSDKTRLKQVLINLLSNAIKYNTKHGTVTVYCQPIKTDRIRISVVDTGIGLSSEQLKEIFQPFNRLGREKSQEEGSGIGLAFTKKIIEAMHAEIGVNSAVGLGSTFWIELPVNRLTAPVSNDFVGEPS